jgi:hypothetical protein
VVLLHRLLRLALVVQQCPQQLLLHVHADLHVLPPGSHTQPSQPNTRSSATQPRRHSGDCHTATRTVSAGDRSVDRAPCTPPRASTQPTPAHAPDATRGARL